LRDDQLQAKNTRAFASRDLLPFGRFTDPRSRHLNNGLATI
jgi:hypothetical protein